MLNFAAFLDLAHLHFVRAEVGATHLAASLMAMCQHCAQVAHSAAGNEDGSFLANHSCCQLLEPVDGGIVSPDIVAYLSL